MLWGVGLGDGAFEVRDRGQGLWGQVLWVDDRPGRMSDRRPDRVDGNDNRVEVREKKKKD